MVPRLATAKREHIRCRGLRGGADLMLVCRSYSTLRPKVEASHRVLGERVCLRALNSPEASCNEGGPNWHNKPERFETDLLREIWVHLKG